MLFQPTFQVVWKIPIVTISGINNYVMKIVECMGGMYTIIPTRFDTDDESIEDKIVNDYFVDDAIESILILEERSRCGK